LDPALAGPFLSIHDEEVASKHLVVLFCRVHDAVPFPDSRT
jgi:hypothetical protein